MSVERRELVEALRSVDRRLALREPGERVTMPSPTEIADALEAAEAALQRVREKCEKQLAFDNALLDKSDAIDTVRIAAACRSTLCGDVLAAIAGEENR